MMHIQCLEEVVERDPRYAYEAYEFVFAALAHTQKLLGRLPREEPDEEEAEEDESEPCHHVSGAELLHGIRDFALREFGLMARTVFRMWGINKTADFGEIVFNLISAGLMSKTDEDTRADFADVYDLDEALVHDYRIEVTEGD
jgi:uncharacterized repeat protein (TIGR04138 family)